MFIAVGIQHNCGYVTIFVSIYNRKSDVIRNRISGWTLSCIQRIREALHIIACRFLR